MTLADLNKKIKKINPHLELVRGEGYHYFVFDDGHRFETESIMVMYTNCYSSTEWLAMAQKFRASDFKSIRG